MSSRGPAGDGGDRGGGLGERLYRFLLLAYPRSFRREYGEELIHFFRRRRSRLRRRDAGSGDRVRFWAALLRDLLVTSVAERRGVTSRRSRLHPLPSRSPRHRKERPVDTLRQDLSHAARRLAGSPGFTAVAVLVVAMGIGINAALFSVVDALLWEPHPWERPEEVVWIYQDADDGEPSSTSYPAYLDIAERTEVFSGVTAVLAQWSTSMVTDDGRLRRLVVSHVTSSYPEVLGLETRIGRWFTDGEDEPGGPAVAVLSHRLWRTDFGADPEILGRTMRLGGAPVTIVGVGPEGYEGTLPASEVDAWLSISAMGPVQGSFARATLDRREDHWFFVLARLAAGVTESDAQAAMDVLAARLGAEYPALNEGRDITVFSTSDVRIHPDADGDLYPLARFMLGVGVLVLLIACGNLANLMLSRASSRNREVAVRLALGATRFRVVRHLLTESIVVAAAGGLVGLFLAAGLGQLLEAYPPSLSLPFTLEVGVDPRVLGFGLAVSLLTGVLFGVVPALRASTTDPVAGLKDPDEVADRGSGPGRRGMRRWLTLRNGLLSAQVAASLVLLVATGLLARSVQASRRADLGFAVEEIAVVGTALQEAGYARGDDAEAAIDTFYRRLRDRIAALPGVESVARTTRLPLGGGGSSTLEIEGYEGVAGTGAVEVDFANVDPDYFDTLGIPLRHGRIFSEADGDAQVAVVSEAMARRYYGTADAVGRRFRHQSSPETWTEIIGVVGDVAVESPGEKPTPFFYYSLVDETVADLFTVARTAADPGSTAATMRDVVREIDAAVPVTRAATMERQVSRALAVPRAASRLLAVCSALAVLLAGFGLYGVVSFWVARRTGEVGIRRALGARDSQVVGMIVRETMVPVAAGLVLGCVLVAAAVPVLEGFLYGVSPADPVTFVAVTAILVATSLLAAWIPARRATRIDPVGALRRA